MDRQPPREPSRCAWCASSLVIALLVVAVVFGIAGPADVRAQSWLPDAMFTQIGKGTSTESWSAGLQWHWNREWQWGQSLMLRGRWELALGRWRVELGEQSRDWAWITELSAAPSLRLSDATQTGWYGELGVGPSLLLPVYRSQDRRFSTQFNFQSHLSAGYVWGTRGEHDVGLRVEHYSNAGIRKPNPGVDLGALRYTYRF